jgi:hypothetical protein
MRFTTTLLCISFFLCSFSQTLSNTIQGISLLGTKLVGNQLLLLSRTEKNEVKLMALNDEGQQNWATSFEVASLGGYNFNQIQLVGDDEFIFVVQQLSRQTLIKKLSSISGDEIGEFSIKLETGENPKVWGYNGATLSMVTSQEGLLLKHTLTDKDELNITKMLDIPEKYPNTHIKVNYAKNKEVYTSTRVLEPNHGLMHLYLSKYNLETGDTMEKEIDLELAHTSFTYNSSVDQEVYGMFPSSTGFYLIGKLDIAFKKKYPTGKVGDNFIGFWVAKFNEDLSLDYFSEIPFQYLDYLVPTDVIKKPTVIDLKEDANGGVFLNINELQGVVYGSKYFVYLTDTGELGMAKGGLDEYHFMEYDRLGLRNAGRKNRIRVMDDQWTAFATDAFLYLSPKPGVFSDYSNKLLTLAAKENRYLRMDKSYNFFKMNGHTLYLEHFSKKKGTLNIYID